jgi:two-component system nitrate/nitrite response regulator NarL
MTANIRVAILDDHQGIIDGYLYRLIGAEDIEVVATMTYGEELEPTLDEQSIDVLLLDVQVPTSQNNINLFPILHLMPKLLQCYPSLYILIISMHHQRTLIKSMMESGASGFILKDDKANIQRLDQVIRDIANGEIVLSDQAYQQLIKRRENELSKPLSPRELEAISLCAAYPDLSTAELAKSMDIAHSTLRNLLSGAYLKLNVRNRTAAIAKARQLDLLAPDTPNLDL